MPRPDGGFVAGAPAPGAATQRGIWSARDVSYLRGQNAWSISNPDEIANLAVWLDANDSGTLFDATSGGSAVAADGGVARWRDKSANAFDAIQGTANNRPTRKTSIQNGRDVLRFDGSNDTLQIASVTLQTYITAFVVSSTTRTATNLKFWFEHGASIGSNAGFFFNGTFAGAWAFNRSSAFHTGPNTDNTDWIGTGWALATLAYDGTGWIYKNTTPVTNIASQGTARSNTNATAALNIGSRNQASLHITGDIGEILIYNARLSETAIATVWTWLNNRWAIY